MFTFMFMNLFVQHTSTGCVSQTNTSQFLMFKNLPNGLNLKCFGSPWRCLWLGMTLSNMHLIGESHMGW